MNLQAISSSPPPRMSFDIATVGREVKDKVVTGSATPAPTPTAAQEAQPVSREKIEAAVDSVREYIAPINNNLEFSIDDETDQVVVKIVDAATREVLRQMPSEDKIAIAKALDSLKGLFVKQRV